MNIEEMNMDELIARQDELRSMIDGENFDTDAIETEWDAIEARINTMNAEASKRAEIRKKIADGTAGVVVRKFESEERKMDEIYAVNSEEYRTAWLKALRGNELNEMEKRAFTSSNGAISTLVVNDIMSVVRDAAPLLARMTTITAGSKITYYVEGTNTDAVAHTENATISAAADTLTSVTLTPAEIVKMIQISEAAQEMSINAFNAWLAKTLGEAIARKINATIITKIVAAASSAGTSITAATVQALLGSVKGNASIVCNRKTLYTALLPLQDNSKNALVRFDGGAATVYGVEVLLDDNVADNVVLAGDLAKVVAALAENVAVRNQYDINTNSYKYLGVALFDCAVGLASAFGKIAAA